MEFFAFLETNSTKNLRHLFRFVQISGDNSYATLPPMPYDTYHTPQTTSRVQWRIPPFLPDILQIREVKK